MSRASDLSKPSPRAAAGREAPGSFDDLHAHTDLSYCCDAGLTPATYARAVRDSDVLNSVAITNHGFAIYFPEDIAWNWEFMTDPSMFDEHLAWGNERLIRHLDEVDTLRDRGLWTGVEVEMMADGRLTVDPDLIDRLDVIVGSVHWLPVRWRLGHSPSEILETWLTHTAQLIQSGIDVLGHPFRWLSAQIDDVPDELIPHVVELAREADVAIEINAHYVVHVDVPLLCEAARSGAKVTFCTDAHHGAEIAQFDYHSQLLRRADLALDDLDVWTPSRRKR